MVDFFNSIQIAWIFDERIAKNHHQDSLTEFDFEHLIDILLDYSIKLVTKSITIE